MLRWAGARWEGSGSLTLTWLGTHEVVDGTTLRSCGYFQPGNPGSNLTGTSVVKSEVCTHSRPVLVLRTPGLGSDKHRHSSPLNRCRYGSTGPTLRAAEKVDRDLDRKCFWRSKLRPGTHHFTETTCRWTPALRLDSEIAFTVASVPAAVAIGYPHQPLTKL